MFLNFSWLINFNFGFNFRSAVAIEVTSEERQLKLYQRRFDANKKVLYHRQQKK